MMYLKVHHIPGVGEVVAACDSELLGVTLMYGDVEIYITGGFYGTERATEEEISQALTDSTNANIIGKRVVAIAIALGLVGEEDCVMIGGIPHAQVFGI